MRAIDLFAGAGGFSTGARLAGATVVWAANHWQSAVDIHAKNHPLTEHACQDLHQANWEDVPDHDLLLASPCCQGHSKARGAAHNNPKHDASRATAWAVVSAIEYHRPTAGVVENVPEFQDWVLFPAWLAALSALGYSAGMHVVDAANHGVPQNRERLLIVLTKSKSPLQLALPKREHVAARSFIDFEKGNWSPLHRPGRAAATLARAEAGRREFGERFLMPYYGSGSGLTGRSLDRPIGTITTRARWALVDGDRMRMLRKEETRDAMSFPKDYHLPESTTLATHMLGNAVPPLVARDFVQALQQHV